MATDYDALDEATLQRMAGEAESYEERSAIRQAIRRKKKDRGENVGHSRARGNSVYNRFAGSTAPKKQTKPKNYVITEAEAAAIAASPPPSGGGRESSRGSTTPTQTQRETPSSPVPRPRTPTPPPTPEQSQQEEEEETPLGGGEEERSQEETDVAPAEEEEAPPSPPPSPQTPAEPHPVPAQQEEEEKEEPDGEERTPVAELPEEGEGEQEEEREPEREEEEERGPSPAKEEKEEVPPPSEEQPASPKEERASRRGREETDSGGARFGGVTLKSRRTEPAPTQKPSSSEPQNEFLKLKLRQTSRDGGPSPGRKTEPEPKVDFRGKLKSTPREKPPVSPPTHKRAEESRPSPSSSDHGTPRTMRDYQELSSRSAARGRGKREQNEEFEPPTMEPDELQKYLVAYVNSELSLDPPLPVRGGALFESCSNPTNLCKLVNKSVPNTVDLRALSRISSSASDAQRNEALKENMTLALESARAIGCRVSDDSTENILSRNPQAIRDFLVDLIRAKAVNLPGMDDEPSSTFTNMVTLFEKLAISVPSEEEAVDTAGDSETKEEVSWRDDREKVRKALESPPPKVVEKETWRDTPPSKAPTDTTEMSYEERAAMRRAQRERERKARQAAESGGVELSYEERAAQRKAERERRRREREALAK